MLVNKATAPCCEAVVYWWKRPDDPKKCLHRLKTLANRKMVLQIPNQHITSKPMIYDASTVKKLFPQEVYLHLCCLSFLHLVHVQTKVVSSYADQTTKSMKLFPTRKTTIGSQSSLTSGPLMITCCATVSV